MHSIIIFASGAGTNAAAIIAHFKQVQLAKVVLIVTNKPEAGVLSIAERERIPSLVISNSGFGEAAFIGQLQALKPSLIVLAGFLRKIPTPLLEAFRSRIINIHPALLPEHGGKGMYGHHVHNAVIAAGKTESGITIHYVDEVYDHGNIILQARCPVLNDDTAEILAERVHSLEHFYFPRAIEFLLRSK